MNVPLAYTCSSKTLKSHHLDLKHSFHAANKCAHPHNPWLSHIDLRDLGDCSSSYFEVWSLCIRILWLLNQLTDFLGSKSTNFPNTVYIEYSAHETSHYWFCSHLCFERVGRAIRDPERIIISLKLVENVIKRGDKVSIVTERVSHFNCDELIGSERVHNFG